MMVLVTVVTFAGFFALAVGQLDGFERYRIDTLMENIRMCTGAPGLQVGIVRNGVKAYMGSYGNKDLRGFNPITFDTIWPYGSLTKSFTGWILAEIIEKNPSLTWDTKLKSIMPELEMSDPVRTEEASIRDLVSHRMATSGYSGGWLLYTGGDGMTRAEMPSKMKYFESDRPFRGEFHYNNWMYTLAGHFAERVTGKTWETLIREQVYQRLRMNSGTFGQDIVNNPRVPKSHGLDSRGAPAELCTEPLETFTLQGPGGGMAGTADDMLTWAQYHIERGQLPDGSFPVSGSTLYQTYGGQMAVPQPGPEAFKPSVPKSWIQSTYGAGWFGTQYNGFRLIHHSGSVLGYSTYLTILPDIGMGIFSAANAPIGNMHRVIAMFISDLLNPYEQPWINENNPCGALQEFQNNSTFEMDWTPAGSYDEEPTKEEESHTRVETSPTRLDDYVGEYHHGFFGKATISRDGAGLKMVQGKYGRLLFRPTGTSHTFAVEDDSCLKPTRPPGMEQYAHFVDTDQNGSIDSFTVEYLDNLNDVYFTKEE